MPNTDLSPAYEIHNPSFNDMTLEQQIDAGICDWCAEDADGHQFVGETKDKAEANRTAHCSGRAV